MLELDPHLVEIAGMRYKVDTNHDIVYLEFDEPTLSIREILAIFPNLSLKRLSIGAIPTELQSRNEGGAAERGKCGSVISDQNKGRGHTH